MLIIFEYASHGDLLKYLRINRDESKDFGKLTLNQLVEMAWQTANGMTYLEQMKVFLIHSPQF